MNKAELTDVIAEKVGLSKADAGQAIDAFWEAVMGALVKGDTVPFIGIGTFSTGERAARKGRNPQTGAEIDIPASTVVKFKVGAKLKEAVNK